MAAPTTLTFRIVFSPYARSMIADQQNPFSIDSLCQLQKVSGQCHLPFKSEHVCSSARRLHIPLPLVNYRTLDRNYTEAFPPLSILYSMLLHPFPSRKAKVDIWREDFP